MTINKGSFSEGLEPETGTWFGYMNYPLNDGATSTISREDMLEKFCQKLADKLQKIEKVIGEFQ